MRKNMQLLDELQGLDLRGDSLRAEIEALAGEVAALEAKVEEARAQLSEKNIAVACLAEDKQLLEENIAAEADNIGRSEVRLKEIKTQKEYQAVSKEISTAKKQKGELEEQVLQKLSRIEELQAEVSAATENLAAMEGNIAGQKEEISSRIAALETELSGHGSERETLVKQIPASLQKRYAILRVQRRGVAVAEARDGSCLGCNMGIPPQMYNSLFKADELICCPHCQRMLVLRLQQTA